MTTSTGRPGVDAGFRAVRRPRHGLRWLAVLAVVGSVLIGALFGARLNRDATLVATPLIGRLVPGRVVPFLEGRGTTSLRDLRGDIIVVNFWASWCTACRKEHPSLIAAASAYRKAGVRFVGVDFQDSRSAAIGFLNEMGRGRDNYRFVGDPGSRLAIDFGVYGVPETFFIDRKGRIVAKITGAATLPLVAGVLDRMLAGGRPDPTMSPGPVKGSPG